MPVKVPGRVCLIVSSAVQGLMLLSVVTGASEGIGREFALQLARKGFNVVVSARNSAALDALVAEIGPKLPFYRTTRAELRLQSQVLRKERRFRPRPL